MPERKSLFSPPFFRIFIPFGAAYFLAILVSSSNAIMSPILIDTFGLSPFNLGLISSIYLISFGATQIPLGVMLDRYGAGRTLAPLLLSAAAGAAVYSASGGFVSLVLSRMLLGIGLAGCLMAAFKGYADWIGSDKLPLAYSMQSFMGGLGAMAATRPLAIAFEIMNWRVIFAIFAVGLVFAAAAVFYIVPRKPFQAEAKKISISRQFIEMIRFTGDRRFWAVAPICITSESVMFAYVFLWLGPWMRDVALFTEEQAGLYLLFASGGVAAGYFLNGIVADLFKRKGWLSWESLYLICGVILTLLLAFIAFGDPHISAPVWPFVMFFSTMAMIAFPIMRNRFETDEVGRVLSLLNLAIFVMSFLMQWLIGAILELYPAAGGHFSPAGYKAGLIVFAALNLAAIVHFCRSKIKKNDDEDA
ncbi:MAG: MFS transporter [Synergistaceae bacterium]|nr:MFS transporter [Synergistaceae bacterium]